MGPPPKKKPQVTCSPHMPTQTHPHPDSSQNLYDEQALGSHIQRRYLTSIVNHTQFCNSYKNTATPPSVTLEDTGSQPTPVTWTQDCGDLQPKPLNEAHSN